MHEMNYLDIESPSGVFNSEEAEEAGTASRHVTEGDDGEKHLLKFHFSHLDARHGYFRSLSVRYRCLPRTVICDKSAHVGRNTTNWT